MEDAMANTILKELREFREENNKRWDENDKRWEENDRRWEQNDKRWEENNKRWDENTINLAIINQRLIELEEDRKKDKKEIIEALDTMQKSIDNQFTEMKEYFDAKFEKVYAVQRVHEVENEQFKKILYAYEKRFNFHNSRLNYLEQWKDKFDMGQFEAV